jgi:hypothetical protein
VTVSSAMRRANAQALEAVRQESGIMSVGYRHEGAPWISIYSIGLGWREGLIAIIGLLLVLYIVVLMLRMRRLRDSSGGHALGPGSLPPSRQWPLTAPIQESESGAPSVQPIVRPRAAATLRTRCRPAAAEPAAAVRADAG